MNQRDYLFKNADASGSPGIYFATSAVVSEVSFDVV